jgi:Fe-S-cluster containining protein
LLLREVLTMGRSRFHIVNMVEASRWARLRAMPRFLQPLDASLTPCAGCTASCCALDARLSSVEALALAIQLRLPVDDVVARVPPGISPLWYAPSIPLEGGPVTLALRRLPDGTCAFLHRVAGHVRCAIHALRPGVCRLYPFDVVHGRRRITVGSQVFCPCRWLQDGDTRRRTREDLERWLGDLRADTALLRAWARHGGPGRAWPDFVRFAGARVAKMVGVDPAEVFQAPRVALGRPCW